jgi:endonuclease/exonuclease/phosphatase family metal-dependent hydrolase
MFPSAKPSFRRAINCLALCWLALRATVALLPADTLTVATYNIENYTFADRMEDGVYQKDFPKPEAEKAALRKVIHLLKADVLALQEMGGPPFLEELRRDLKTEGLDYPYSALVQAEDTDRHIGLLSRVPLGTVIRHAELTFKYQGGTGKVKRGLLEVHLKTGSTDWALFVVHLKSRFDSPNDPASELLRAGEAEAVRDCVLRAYPDPATARFLIVGDCNALHTERPIRALLARGKTTICEELPATDSRGEVWTHFWLKEDTYQRIDHALASPGLRPLVAEAHIMDAPETMQASDHRPLVIVLKTP